MTGFCADRMNPDRAEGVIPSGWALRHLSDEQRGSDDIFRSHGIAILFRILNAPNLLGGLDLREVLNANLGACHSTCFHEIWDSNRGHKADDRYHNHDLNECEGVCASPKTALFLGFHAVFWLPPNNGKSLGVTP